MRFPIELALVAVMHAMVTDTARAAVQGDPANTTNVAIDSARHLVVITSTPSDLDAARAGEAGDHAGHAKMPPTSFVWPVSGWIRGMSLRVLGEGGKPLPRSLVHHLVLINPGRRELLCPVAERLLEFGGEAADIRLPAGIGVPVTAGMPLLWTGA